MLFWSSIYTPGARVTRAPVLALWLPAAYRAAISDTGTTWRACTGADGSRPRAEARTRKGIDLPANEIEIIGFSSGSQKREASHWRSGGPGVCDRKPRGRYQIVPTKHKFT